MFSALPAMDVFDEIKYWRSPFASRTSQLTRRFGFRDMTNAAPSSNSNGETKVFGGLDDTALRQI
jgi:hypothetical protein